MHRGGKNTHVVMPVQGEGGKGTSHYETKGPLMTQIQYIS